MQKRMPPALQ